MKLKYIDPSRFIPGVPARDLADDEVEKYGGAEELVASGLYVIVKEKRAAKKKDDE